MSQPDPFWKELIERKNQEILDKFVESFDKPIQAHQIDSKQAIFKKEWKEITSNYAKNFEFKFTVFDLNDQELGKVKTKQEGINLFMNRYPQFDKKAIEPFIIEN